MKAATGELNLTIITLIAIAAVIGFFWICWGPIKEAINDQWHDVIDQRDTTANTGTY